MTPEENLTSRGDDLQTLVIRYQTDRREDDLLKIWKGVRRFVFQVMKNYPRIDKDDGGQEAFLSLLDALETYQADRAQFLTYYGYHLQKAFTRLSAGLSAAYIPRNRQNDIIQRRKRNAVREMTGSAYREESSGDLDDRAAAAMTAVYLSSPVPGKDKDMREDLSDTIPDPADHIAELCDDLDRETMRRVLWEEVERLPDDEAEAVRRKYQEDATAEKVAAEMGQTVPAIRRKLDKGLRKLRNRRRKLEPYLPETWDVYTRGNRWTSPEELYMLRQEEREARMQQQAEKDRALFEWVRDFTAEYRAGHPGRETSTEGGTDGNPGNFTDKEPCTSEGIRAQAAEHAETALKGVLPSRR